MQPRPLREFGDDPTSGRKVVAKDGRFGVYVTDGETNASIVGDRIEEISPERAFELSQSAESRGRQRSAQRRSLLRRNRQQRQPQRNQLRRKPHQKTHDPAGIHRIRRAEACGKSTQAQRLAESIGAVLTRETGGTDIGAQLRSILHNVDTVGLDDHAETLIVAADRAQHLAELFGRPERRARGE